MWHRPLKTPNLASNTCYCTLNDTYTNQYWLSSTVHIATPYVHWEQYLLNTIHPKKNSSLLFSIIKPKNLDNLLQLIYHLYFISVHAKCERNGIGFGSTKFHPTQMILHRTRPDQKNHSWRMFLRNRTVSSIYLLLTLLSELFYITTEWLWNVYCLLPRSLLMSNIGLNTNYFYQPDTWTSISCANITRMCI